MKRGLMLSPLEAPLLRHLSDAHEHPRKLHHLHIRWNKLLGDAACELVGADDDDSTLRKVF